MLAELWHYWGVRSAGSGARRLGYAYEAAALEVRHRRCRAAWQSHLDATRAVLVAAANRCDGPTRVAWIVGGGIAHDLPLTELLAIFQHIVLIDIVFARSTRRLASSWPGRVTCCYWDVTGCVDWLARQRRIPPAEIFTAPKMPEHMPKADWLASVNCLTQLPLLPIGWLQHQGADERSSEAFGRLLVKKHLAWLRAWGVPYCLISEVSDSRHGADGTLIEHTDYRPLLEDFMQSAALTAQWSWTLHPPGELPAGAWETRQIEAWEDRRQL